MSRGSSTTHTIRPSRRSSAQNTHSSSSVTLKQRLQNRTRSLASVIADASRATSSAGTLRRWKAIRCADFGPMPGSRPSSSISVWTGGEYALGTSTALDDLGAGEGLGESVEGARPWTGIREVVQLVQIDRLGAASRPDVLGRGGAGDAELDGDGAAGGRRPGRLDGATVLVALGAMRLVGGGHADGA